MTLADRHRKVLVGGGTSPRYVPTAGSSGHFLYLSQATLFAVSGWTGVEAPLPDAPMVIDWVKASDPKPLVVVDSLVAFMPGAEVETDGMILTGLSMLRRPNRSISTNAWTLR